MMKSGLILCQGSPQLKQVLTSHQPTFVSWLPVSLRQVLLLSVCVGEETVSDSSLAFGSGISIEEYPSPADSILPDDWSLLIS
jgi:hypothetical protein